MTIATRPRELAPMRFPPLSAQPLISVLMSNYNHGRFIPDAVDSVMKQTYQHFELIVCDDGSTDDSREVLDSLAASDARIRVLYKENGGQVSAWNLAFEHAHGEIICFLDADDMFTPDKLEKVVAAFVENPNAGRLSHRYQLTDADGTAIGVPAPRTLESGWLADTAFDRGGWHGGNAADLTLRRELVATLFPLPSGIQFGDAYILGTSQFLTEIAAIQDTLYRYRIHGENHSGQGNIDLMHEPALKARAEVLVRLFPHQQRFLSQRLGADVAARVRLCDLRPLWEHLGALYILGSKPVIGDRNYSKQEILANLSAPSRKYVWKLLFTLPTPVSRRLLRAWWVDAWWKRYARPVASVLRLRS